RYAGQFGPAGESEEIPIRSRGGGELASARLREWMIDGQLDALLFGLQPAVTAQHAFVESVPARPRPDQDAAVTRALKGVEALVESVAGEAGRFVLEQGAIGLKDFDAPTLQVGIICRRPQHV